MRSAGGPTVKSRLSLAAHERVIPDVNIYGAKAELGRRVSVIIDETAGREGGG